MFGYIAVNQAALTPECREKYRACYCGLCRMLKERYGQLGRITLSNDMTFLSMLLQSLYEPRQEHGSRRCALHPIRKRDYCMSEATAYAADMNIILTYYKCLDHLKDDHNPLEGTQAGLLKKAFQKARKLHPEKCGIIAGCLEKISSLEKEDSRDIDALCNLSGEMLGEIFAWKRDAFAEPLWEIGAGLGRFIYFMDAYEDFDADTRKKRFNPLRDMHGQADYEEFCLNTMQMLLSDATQAFDMLPLETNLEILRSVLYNGVWMHYARMHGQKGKEKEQAHGQ